MSVVQYIGRKTDFRGKTLWEIVGNLKGGGIGRIVVRSTWERYPEPSFMKILKVEALPMERPRKVRVLVEKTFRGIKAPKPVLIERVSYKADYRLIPKDEEEKFCTITSAVTEKMIPSLSEFPPLMKEMLLMEYEKNSEEPPQNLHLVLNLSNYSPNSRYVEIEENSEVLPIGLGETKYKHLYKGLQQESNV